MSDLINEEILQEMLGEVPKTISRYVSCIRIDGSPILPPLIDDRYRSELTHYRNLAILVEKKINDRKKLKDNRHSVDSGVMIGVSNGEPSWLRPCSLQAEHKELMTSHSFENDKNKMSCGTRCVQRSNSSDDTCSKNFICDHDVWRYLSNCDEHFCTAWFDNQNEDFLSNFDLGLIANSGHNFPENLASSCNTEVVPCDEFCTKEESNVSNKSKNSVHYVNDEVTRLSEFYAQYNKDMDELNSHPRNIDPNSINRDNDCEKFNSYNCERVTHMPGGNCDIFPSQMNKESNYLSKCKSGETSANCIDNASESALNGETEISEYEQYFVNYSAMSDRFTDLDCSSKSNTSKDPSSKESESCTANKSRKEPISSIKTSSNDAGIAHQESLKSKNENNSTDVHISSLKNVSRNKISSIKISCSSISLPEYPIPLSVQVLDKQKPEKPYNPMYYGGCNSFKIENNEEILCPEDVTEKLPRKWLCDSATNIVSDDSCEELSKNTADESLPYLENSLACQKNNLDVPLSESVSISEVDFHSSSVATIAPDTSEDANELPKHLSAERDNELSPPKLVRQNSYTLITPSPVLLAHAKANEKQEEKTSSEDDNSNNQVKSNEKCQELDKAKGDWNSKTGVKNIYPAPSKQSQIVVQNTDAAKAKESSMQKNKNVSLPGSSVSSPVKVNLFHSSLDNLPIMTVRRFQELIDSQSSMNQPVSVASKTNLFTAKESACGKITLNSRSSSLDLQTLNQNCTDSRLKCRSKSDLQESKCKQPLILNSPQKEESERSRNDIEVLYREISFDPSPSSISHQLDINYISTPRSNQGNQTNFDEISPGFSLGNFSNQNSDKMQGREVMSASNTLSPSDSTVQKIFLHLQNQHSLLMGQLLDRQKKEQEALANTFLNQQRQILQEMRLIPTSPTHVQSPSANSDTGTCGIEKKSPSAPQEIQTFGLVSVGSHLSSNVEMPPPSGNSDQSRYSSNAEHSDSTHHSIRELDLATPSPVPPKAKPHITEEQINAGTIINAAVRGYLVRRLLKTEHVQEIINTISESVQCALQLQRECPVDITPSDVELHRRLIQQLTAACYSLHDTFFVLSTQEKMNIIANDRERRRNPASRPISARTSISAATQKYIQRKQQQNRQSDRPAPISRRSWWRNKTRACSAGAYEQSSSSYSKQPIITSKQQQNNNRATRRPWR